MGVCELNQKNENYKEITNPININLNMDSNNTTDTKSKNSPIQNRKDNEDSDDKDKTLNINSNKGNNGLSKEKTKLKLKTRFININKLNKFIITSKTKYSNYKRVPHLRSEINECHSFLLTNQNIYDEENSIWFKTQYKKFDQIKETSNFTINEYNKKKYNILETSPDINNNILNKDKLNNRNLQINIYNKNKSMTNYNKKKMVYTKALPIDYNNEKKIENLFNINNNNNYEDNLIYILEKVDYLHIQNIKEYFSTKKDYKNIIKKYSYNKFLLANYLLELNERNWYKELSNLSNILLNKRNENDILITNKYIRKTIKFYEQFKWLIESLGVYFNYIIFGKENNHYNFNLNNDMYDLHIKDKMKWFKGFKWKGVYIKVLTNEKSKILINEVKALNYYFFDYLQLCDKYPYFKNNQLLYYIIFPLIAYTEVNGFVLFGSALINVNDNELSENQNILNSIIESITLNDIIKYNNGAINYYNYNSFINFNKVKYSNNTIDMSLNGFIALEKKYYIKDLLCSKLFSELNLYHFIKINKNKFLIFNLYEFIPNLFETKFSNELNINYLSVINNKRVYYNTKSKYNINIKNKDSKVKNNKVKDFSNIKEVLKNIYNINPSLSNLKTKDIIINNINFRIIYEAQSIKDENSKNKQFVDYLFNYNNNSYNNKPESYLVEPYVIIYDLKDTFKLKYSLIKKFYNEKNKNKDLNILNKYYYISTNYISYFTSWCEMLNKNSFNIKNYSDLKENMKKYGICSQLKFFALININNVEIIDIIKISLLVKAIKFIFNKKENDIILYKLNDIKNITNNTDMNKLIEKRKIKILYIIKSILYPNEIINQSKHFFNNLYEDLVFYVNVIFLKLKLIDGYLSLGLLNINKDSNMNINLISKEICGFESPKDFLKHIIKIARNKPFLFLSEMEYKLKFIIDPFIKFKSSISIESMYNKLELKHIIFNKNNITNSYIKSDEISGLILAKLLYINKNEINDININISDFNNYNIRYNINNTNNINNFDYKIKNNNHNLETLNDINNKNSSLKPNLMKNKINLKNYNNNKKFIKNIENKENSSLISSIFTSEIDSTNKTENSNNSNIKNNILKIGNTSEFCLSIDERNKEYKVNESNQRIKILEKEVCNNIIFELPSICYKMNYSYDNFQSVSSKNEVFSKFLKNIYYFPELKIIKKWEKIVNEIFNEISSCNGEIENSLFKTLVYLFIITFFFEKNFNDANKINMRIKDIYKKGNYLLSLPDLSLINLFQALSSEKYIDSEAPYSKSLMLLLMSYGEPRGRNNDAHGMMLFPIWKIARKTFKLEQKFINDYFKEMFQCLSFFEKKKCFLYLYNIQPIFNYSINVYNNNDNNRTILNNISKNININSNINSNNNSFSDDIQNISYESRLFDFLSNNISENPGLDFFGNLSKITNYDITLNQNIFSDKILNKTLIKYFKFPSVSCTTEKLNKIFFKSDFIIYILKEIQSLFMSKKIVYNEDYINEYISNEIFNPYPYNYKHHITYNNDSDINDNFAEEISSNNNINNKNCEICIRREKLEKLKKNNYYVFPNSTNFIYNFIDQHSSQTVKNRKYNNESTLNIKDKKRSTLKSHSNMNINKPREKIKNKSVEGNKKTKNNLFSHFLYNELLQKLSYKLNIQSGIIVSFGNNPHNETSHDNYEKITLPRIIFKLKNIRIDHIYSGWEHNIIITNKAEIYSFGHNQFYQCGLQNNDNNYKIIRDPTNISILNNNIRGISASCGNEHSLILSKDNSVYAFGNNEDGVLGINDCKLKKYEFTKVDFGIYTNRIIGISAGTVHNLALTNDNKIFSWGSSQGGQLGLPEKFLVSQPGYKTSFFLSTPTLITISNNKNNEGIIKIGCGEAHSLALNNSGRVYSWGFGSNGQLGLGFCEDSFEPGTGLTKSRKFTPEIIYSLENEKIIDIQCGKTFSMFINDKNELYACGVNDLNQLGLNEPSSKDHLKNKDIICYDFVFPTKVDCFLNMKVLKISCGEGHCLAIIKDLISNIQTIWSWGNNKFGQLGQGSTVKKSTPNPINYLSEYNSKKFDEISCGGFHSLCLIKYRENLNWIENDCNIIINVIDEIGII